MSDEGALRTGAAALREQADELHAGRRSPLRILLVEDNAVNRRVACGLLAKRGFVVSSATDGKQAVDILEHETFDAVLMDLQMPQLDGFEATRAIRERERSGSTRVPIIALTASAAEGVRDLCLAAGMDDYVSKPIDLGKLIAALERQTGRGSNASKVTTGPPVAPVEDDVLCRDSLLGRLDNDAALFEEVVELMLVELPSLLANVRVAVMKADAKDVARAAHTLKSCVGQLGLNHLMGVAKTLEDMGRDARFDGLAEAFADLEARSERVMEALPGLRARPS